MAMKTRYPLLVTAFTFLVNGTIPVLGQTTKPAGTQPAGTQPAGEIKIGGSKEADFRRTLRPGYGRQFVKPEVAKSADEALTKGLDFLLKAREPSGGWKEQNGPAFTAIVGKAFARDPRYGPTHEVCRKAADFVLRSQQDDGSIHGPNLGLANYETCVAVMFLVDMKTADPRYAQAIDKALGFLRKIQWTEDQGHKPEDAWYGGVHYGTDTKRPDLSNTQMWMEALQQAGVPSNDPAMQKALKYVQRCQDLSQTNDQPWARLPAPDGHVAGGFIYMAAPNKSDDPKKNPNEELSKGGAVESGERPRTYGSMTYAGFKSMMYAGLTKDDPRIKAAFDWITRFYTLDSNPNMPGKMSKQGLFYYYQVFAQAMQLWDSPKIPTANGERNWREDLIQTLLKGQGQNGSWVNAADRWMEGEPAYVTAIAIMALQDALN